LRVGPNAIIARLLLVWSRVRADHPLFNRITPLPPAKGAHLILVTVRENEPFEKALRRFRRKVEREGIRKDIKKNSFHLKPGEKRRLKQRLAEKRRRKAMRRAIKKAQQGR
jgi:small subunit ribosomal protein S21